MNVLDENLLRSQRELLRARRIRCRQIGRDLGRPGMVDQDVLALLRRLGRVAFFTRDLRLAHPGLCDPRICIVTLDVGQHETASFIRRVLRHPALSTQGASDGRGRVGDAHGPAGVAPAVGRSDCVRMAGV